MSFFKKVCPQNLQDRITHALCVGPLSGLKERVEIEVRDYAAQKLCAAFLKLELKKNSPREILNCLCDDFGVDRPVED